jgi:predicted transposase YdaD
MAVTLDIFDQEKVWDMALKAERREGREEGMEEGIEKGREEGAAGIIRICRQMLHLDDQAIIQILMKEMNLPQNRAVAILSNYDHPSSNPD